jgi:hypothetical protein
MNSGLLEKRIFTHRFIDLKCMQMKVFGRGNYSGIGGNNSHHNEYTRAYWLVIYHDYAMSH